MRPGAPRRGGQPQSVPASAAAMAGAVDLAALQARNEAAARAASAPAPTAAQSVVDVTETGFQADVLDRSFQVPVLLVLLSQRAPSGDQLVATLEKLVTAQAGRLVLGRVDADAQPRIVQALQARAVPSVFAVIGGQVVPGFDGALPEDQVSEFLAAVLQAGQQAGLTGAASPAEGDEAPAEPEVPEDPRFTAAEEAFEAGDFTLAAQRYQAILDQEPANADAQAALGQVRLFERLGSIDQDAAARADGSPADVDAQFAAADLSFAANDVDGALDRLLTAVTAVSGDERDRVRKRIIEYFDLLGADDPRVAPARRRLTRALF